MQASSINKRLMGAEAGRGDTADTAFDVRSRMIVTLLCSAATVAVSSFEGQGVLFLASFLYALSVRRYRALFIAYAGLSVMAGMAALFTFGISALVPSMPFTFRGLAVPFLRGAVMLNVVLPLALTCRIQELLTALKSMRLPFCIYIPGAVMIRFIPTFMNDIRQVAETLKIRGYNLSFGEMFRHPLMMLRLLFTPLLFRSLRTSEELGIAAELKGLEAGGRFVPFRSGAWTGRDTALVLLAVIVAALALYFHVTLGGESAGMR